MSRLLFVSLLTGLWQSLEVAQCQNLHTYTNVSLCYDTSSGKTCFTTFLANNGRPLRQPFKEASNWCKVHVPGSSLIVIDNLEKKRTVDVFIERQLLANETIFMDARKLSEVENVYWSWVNGHPSIPTDVKTRAQTFQNVACMEMESEQRLVFRAGNDSEFLHYICEYSDSRRTLNYRHNNSYYFASEGRATWYDARNECLRLRGDLAFITDLNMIWNWSQLKESRNKRYWIGLHRNTWLWNSTGAAITYTNWEGGYPNDVYDQQCICINPKCKSENNEPICVYDRKWWSCNCDHNHAIVCQREEKTSGDVTTDFTGKMLPSTSTAPNTAITPTTTPFKEVTPDVATYIATIVNNIVPESDITTVSTVTSSLDQKLSNHFTEDRTNAFTSSSSSTTEDFNSATTKKTLLILLCVVVFILIIGAFVVVIRKRKHDKRNESSHMGNTKQCEAVTSQYATVVPGSRPPEATASTACPIYADVEMTQPSTPSNNTIYASVQPTSETIDMGKSVVYADLSLPVKDQQKPGSADKVPVSLSPIYSEPLVPPMSEYAEPFKPDNKSTATAPVPNHYYNIAAVNQHNV